MVLKQVDVEYSSLHGCIRNTPSDHRRYTTEDLAKHQLRASRSPWLLERNICAVLGLVAQSCLTFCDPMDCTRQAPLSMGILQARILVWVAMLSPRGSSQPRDRTQVSCIEADSLPSEPPGNPKNTEVGSQSVLQGNFSTQGSNWGLLHCRWILYHLPGKLPPTFFFNL